MRVTFKFEDGTEFRTGVSGGLEDLVIARKKIEQRESKKVVGWEASWRMPKFIRNVMKLG